MTVLAAAAAPFQPDFAPVPRVILFDLGGVLIDVRGPRRLHELTGGALAEDAVWHWWLTAPEVQAFESGRLPEAEFFSWLRRRWNMPLDAGALRAEFLSWPAGLFPGAMDFLRQLASRFTLGCLSNNNPVHWPVQRDRMGLGAVFVHPFLSHEIGHVKPDAAIFEHVIRMLGLPAEALLFLDDNAMNVNAARRHGLQADLAAGLTGAQDALRRRGLWT